MNISRNETDNTKRKSFKKFLIVGGVVEAHFCVQLKVRPAKLNVEDPRIFEADFRVVLNFLIFRRGQQSPPTWPMPLWH